MEIKKIRLEIPVDGKNSIVPRPTVISGTKGINPRPVVPTKPVKK